MQTQAVDFDWWLIWIVLPLMKPGMWLVMDNARIHRRRYLRHICSNVGVNLLFLPRCARLRSHLCVRHGALQHGTLLRLAAPIASASSAIPLCRRRYTPEYNPIEMAFGWIKRCLIKIGPVQDHSLVRNGQIARACAFPLRLPPSVDALRFAELHSIYFHT